MDAKEQGSSFTPTSKVSGRGADVKQQRPSGFRHAPAGSLRPPASAPLAVQVRRRRAPADPFARTRWWRSCGLRDQDIRKDEYAKLLPLLEEAEFSEVTRLTLELLDIHGLPDDARALLTKLMRSPHSDVQKFALRKMGEVGSPATVRTLVEQLGDADYRRRDVAAGSLRKIPEARAALIKELLGLRRCQQSLSIVELLPSFEGKWRQDTLDALWKRPQKPR
jgi:hypothetical protein